MTKNNRERQAAFKVRMRDAGKKQITVWVTLEQELVIRTLLSEEAEDAPAKKSAKATSPKQEIKK